MCLVFIHVNSTEKVFTSRELVFTFNGYEARDKRDRDLFGLFNKSLVYVKWKLFDEFKFFL